MSQTLVREYERYQLDTYLKQHRYTWVRKMVRTFNNMLPAYVKVHWRYPEMISVPYTPKRFTLLKRFVKELSLLGKMALHIHRIKPYLKTVKSVKKLKK